MEINKATIHETLLSGNKIPMPKCVICKFKIEDGSHTYIASNINLKHVIAYMHVDCLQGVIRGYIDKKET